MNRQEIIQAASYAVMKNYDYETMMYCDYMYGNTKYMEEVWEVVEEVREKGLVWFRGYCMENNYDSFV